MNPISFSRLYRFDERIVDGSYFPAEPVDIVGGDVVGVLLLNLGGPRKADDVAPFLYNLFMDPAIIDIPLRGRLRHWLARLISSMRAKKVGEDYRAISTDGGSPINRLTEEQSDALERELNERYGASRGITYRTFIAMRYWHPTSEDAERAMREAGVTKLVLLPLYPHYSKTTTGASLVYWKALEEEGSVEERPTTYVQEYATHPDYLDAISDRIDEALERFPEDVRDDVHLLFSAHGTPTKEMTERRDPYCCLVHSTVEQLLKRRNEGREISVAFQSKVGPATWLEPSTPDRLEELAHDGVRNVLVIPIAFVTDHIETAYELAIEVRDEALEAGIERYEVSGGLNTHPSFIAALAKVVAGQVGYADGDPGDDLPSWSDLPRYPEADRNLRCIQCERICEAHAWPSAS